MPLSDLFLRCGRYKSQLSPPITSTAPPARSSHERTPIFTIGSSDSESESFKLSCPGRLNFIRCSRSATNIGTPLTQSFMALPLATLPSTVVPALPFIAPPLSVVPSTNASATLSIVIHIMQWIMYTDPAQALSVEKGELVYFGRKPHCVQEKLVTKDLVEGMVVWAELCDYNSPMTVPLVQPWYCPPSLASTLVLACSR